MDHMEPLDVSTFPKIWQSLLSWLQSFLPKLFSALLIFVVGYILIRLFLRFVSAVLKKSRLDASLHTFLKSLLKIGLLVLLGLTCASALGMDTTSIITALGAVGLALSLAVKDGLSNLAGGTLILFSKPFSLGNFVSVNDVSGTVEEIGLFYTRLNTPDNKQIFIPNGDITKATVINFSAEKNRRLELIFSIGYGESFSKAQKIIQEIVSQHPYALSDPEPIIRMWEHGDSAIKIICRVWVENPNYWTLHYDLLEQVKEAFDREGISIPFPQMDLHLSAESLQAISPSQK